MDEVEVVDVIINVIIVDEIVGEREGWVEDDVVGSEVAEVV